MAECAYEVAILFEALIMLISFEIMLNFAQNLRIIYNLILLIVCFSALQFFLPLFHVYPVFCILGIRSLDNSEVIRLDLN